MERGKLLTYILDALKSVKDTSIGEGNFGIVVDKFPSKEIFDVCAKYHKFGYNPNEYTVLEAAYKRGLSVPEPLGEWPEHGVFAMRRIFGRNLSELGDMKFSEEVIADIEEAATEVCRYIAHNDLAARNVMLEDIEIKDGVVVSGIPYVIDFGQSRIKDIMDKPEDASEAYDLVSWLRRRSVDMGF